MSGASIGVVISVVLSLATLAAMIWRLGHRIGTLDATIVRFEAGMLKVDKVLERLEICQTCQVRIGTLSEAVSAHGKAIVAHGEAIATMQGEARGRLSSSHDLNAEE